MSKDVTVGAHGCVIDPEVKDAGLSPCEVGETATVDLLAFATEPSP